ncbi:glycosyltransferase family 2 protein [Fulvivirgaceae bacterium BMA10]|uniref:Glycosyltransferase family 2 protein n=1 Tax=Splendidivirga corallicola TaxID=3051826 RepID=A0ABT8KKX1_9BACT|nr:glycosyltransferase family 2 protein [Fulvivirgaceae bacterium BMA10]
MLKTAIVILNYNGRDFLERFLPLVKKHSTGHQIIVADNLSTDDSVSFLQSTHPDIQLIQLTNNFGYAGGYNAALEKIEATYYVLLNSDIEVTPGWIEPIIDLMDQFEDIAACQPKILSFYEKKRFEYAGAAGGFIDSLGYPFCRGRIFDSIENDHGQYNDTRQVFWASGACLFIRSKVFHELGGFDKDFFAHMEEIDLCWRMQRSGYKIFYNSESTVYHVGGGTLPKSNSRKTYLNFRNNLSMLYKNSGFRAILWKLPLRFTMDLLAGLKFLFNGSPTDFLAILKAQFHFFLLLGSNTRKRQKTLRNPQKTKYEEIYSRSIVYSYYLKKIKFFKDLPF